MLDEMSKILSPLPSIPWTLELTGELVAFALLVCFAGLANLETRFPKIKRPAKFTRQSFQTNLGLFAFNSLFLSACSVTTLYAIAEHYSGYGLLNAITNMPLKALLAFLAMDLVLYLWHVVCHRFDFLWTLHRVHHNDPHLNVSTAFRLHFVEVLATNGVKAMLIILLGIDQMLVLMLETVVTLSIMFHHANIKFKYEHALSRLIIVPYLHRVHHSTERSEHDRNYGAILSVWDKLFGTLLDVDPKHIGIKGNSPQDLFRLVAFGFGVEPPVAVELPANLDLMIAEAAYYKAEKRNFSPGYDYRDWLEAKAEIVGRFSGKKRQQRNSFAARLAGAIAGKAGIWAYRKAQKTLRQQALKNQMQGNIEWR